MVKVSHKQIMRAILFHGLNVGCDSQIKKVPFVGVYREWKELDGGQYGNVVAREWEPSGYANSEETIEKYACSECTEAFYWQYVKTVPETALHCSTCVRKGICNIRRKDPSDYCIGWKEKNKNNN